jgi:hypothetical protein
MHDPPRTTAQSDELLALPQPLAARAIDDKRVNLVGADGSDGADLPVADAITLFWL